MDAIKTWTDILVNIAVLFGGIWAVIKVKQYRELKQRIQLDIDANIYKLSFPENVSTFNWEKLGKRISTPIEPHTHYIEILLKFTNKGSTRLRLYNLQVGVNTMREKNKAEFDSDDGHLHLTRITTSGNLVPIFKVKEKLPSLIRFINRYLLNSNPDFAVEKSPILKLGLDSAVDLQKGDISKLSTQFQANNITLIKDAKLKPARSNWVLINGDQKYFIRRKKQTWHVYAQKYKPIEDTSFYYIEPGVEQTISHLALIKEPRELVQIFAKFSLEQKRIFPISDIGTKGVYPHTAARTFQINSNGLLVK